MRLAASRTFCTAGNKSPMRTAIIAITTSNSMSVNAPLGARRHRQVNSGIAPSQEWQKPEMQQDFGLVIQSRVRDSRSRESLTRAAYYPGRAQPDRKTTGFSALAPLHFRATRHVTEPTPWLRLENRSHKERIDLAFSNGNSNDSGYVLSNSFCQIFSLLTRSKIARGTAWAASSTPWLFSYTLDKTTQISNHTARIFTAYDFIRLSFGFSLRFAPPSAYSGANGSRGCRLRFQMQAHQGHRPGQPALSDEGCWQ